MHAWMLTRHKQFARNVHSPPQDHFTFAMTSAIFAVHPRLMWSAGTLPGLRGLACGATAQSFQR
jgi:hypothetical protein